MRNKLKRTGKKQNYKTVTGGACEEIIRQMIEYVLAAVVFILCVEVPLYAKDGYHQIGNAKFEAYRRIMIGGFSVLLVLAAV